MTKKYNLAILLPTRGRTHALDRSVRTLIDNAHNMDNVQIMFGFDRDDDVGLTHFKSSLQPELDQRGVDYVAVQFNPLGYININRYGNILAQHANADWYMFWNDDAIMETPEWDRIIGERTGEFKLLAVHTHNDHPYSIFPIVPAEWMDILGHLSPHQMIDAWLSQQAYMLDIMDRLDRISDQVKDEDTHRLRRIRISHAGDDPSVNDCPIDRLRRIVTIRMAVDHQAVGIIGRHARHDRICIHTDIRHDRTPAIGR